MCHVGVADVVEEEVQEAVGAVHGSQGTPQPVPLLVVVVGQLGVGVLQQGDGDQPAVHNQVRDNIHLHSCANSESL